MQDKTLLCPCYNLQLRRILWHFWLGNTFHAPSSASSVVFRSVQPWIGAGRGPGPESRWFLMVFAEDEFTSPRYAATDFLANECLNRLSETEKCNDRSRRRHPISGWWWMVAINFIFPETMWHKHTQTMDACGCLWDIKDMMMHDWLVVWLPSILFSQKYWECLSNHPNWRSHIFQRGGEKPPTRIYLLEVETSSVQRLYHDSWLCVDLPPLRWFFAGWDFCYSSNVVVQPSGCRFVCNLH